MTKWKYQSDNSMPINQSPNQGQAALENDWNRAAGGHRDDKRKMFIDGKPITSYAASYNEFETEKNVEDFFDQIILRKIEKDTDRQDHLGINKVECL